MILFSKTYISFNLIISMMNDKAEKYDEIIDRFIEFGEECDYIRSAIVIGSRGREDIQADEWSDLDIVIFTEDVDYFIWNERWLDEIGEYWLTFLEDTPIGDAKERRVLFHGALDVDFAVLPACNFDEIKGDPDIRSTFSKGYKVLIDKDGLFDDIEFIHDEISRPKKDKFPSQIDFDNLVKDFWYHAVWSGKKLLRGEIWVAKFCVDGYMKHKLLNMIEWHTMLKKDEDVREDGRFLEMWADHRIIEDLEKCFSYYDEEDIIRALKETMKLFRWITEEVSDELGYGYDTAAEEKVKGWLEIELA